MAVIGSADITGIVRDTLNRVDTRLIHHGTRVAYIMRCMMDVQGGYNEREIHDCVLLGLLHDIGAYKTEEIDRMVQFETGDVWAHSVYGYLFLRYLSPLAPLAAALLFHHTDAKTLEGLDVPCKDFAQMLNIADRADMVLQGGGRDTAELLERFRGRKFDSRLLDLYQETQRRFQLEERILSGRYHEDLLEFAGHILFSEEETDAYLKMLIFSIDFRSYHTVTHTITTTSISCELARLLGVRDIGPIRYGALLHDLGKIAIPVEILEFPGKLSPQAMTVMRTHVAITEEILNGRVDEKTTRIALRHHEKLDGSGYPRGLCAQDLTLEERIVAVADIMSALCGTRSYKEAFSRERTLSILHEMAEHGQIDQGIVAAVTDQYDRIMDCARRECAPVIAAYERINNDYGGLLYRCQQL